jgi:hypothetical protein
MNKLMREQDDDGIGRCRQRFENGDLKGRVEALGRGIRKAVPVGNADRDSQMDDVMRRLGEIE